MTDVLRPCPFCGGEAEAQTREWTPVVGGGWLECAMRAVDQLEHCAGLRDRRYAGQQAVIIRAAIRTVTSTQEGEP